MKDERLVKLEEAMRNEEFLEKVATCKNAEEFKVALDTKDIIFTEEEAKEMFAVIYSQISENGELSEESLNVVSGGWVGGVIFVGGCLVAGYLYGKYGQKVVGICPK